MTVAVPATGPSPADALQIGALRQRLARDQAAVARLQINRTPQPLSLGGLSNMDPSVDGARVSDGQVPVYDAATGRYKPGSGGASLPTLSYVPGYPAGVLTNTGPFVVDVPAPITLPSFMVRATDALARTRTLNVSYGGTLSSEDSSPGFSAQTFPGMTARLAVNFSNFGTSDVLVLNLPFVGSPVANDVAGTVTSSALLSDAALCYYPVINTPTYTSGVVRYNVVLIATSLDGADWLLLTAAINLGPSQNYQTLDTDFTIFEANGSDLSVDPFVIATASEKAYTVTLSVLAHDPNVISP